AAEPGIEDVLFLAQLGAWPAAHGAGRRAVELVRNGDVTVRAVPRRDAVAPPQLALDVPVMDVLHPVEERLEVALWHEAGPARAHAVHRLLSHGLDVDE